MMRLLILVLFSLLLAGCLTTSSTHTDSGPSTDIDVSHIREPVPRAEPLSRRGNPSSYVVHGKRYYVLDSADGFKERGIASWYGNKFHGNQTSNGEIYDMYAMTAAHKRLPLPTYVKVTNLNNQRSITVRVNDRGPFHEGRVIDLSWAAAKKLGIDKTGTAPVEVVAINPGNSAPSLAQDRSGEIIAVQVGAFSTRHSAEQLAAKIKARFKTDVTVSEAKRNGKLLYRVRLGPFDNTTTAREWIELLSVASFGQATLVYLN